ncbi:MAG: chemotaxis-specific protein-glutamate methyltransferase CheB [Elusimicrobiota bacterium]
MINVLIVNDSPTVAELLSYILCSDPALSVVGVARDGEEAVASATRLKPHIIIMDIHMPKLNGFEATRRIMETMPTPILIMSGSTNTDEVTMTFKVLEAGALGIVRQPLGIKFSEHRPVAEEIIRTIKTMSEVKLVRRWVRELKPANAPLVAAANAPSLAKAKVVAIGASTGGPPALHAILSRIPKGFPVPILIVQHMAPGFIGGLASWLASSTDLLVHLAAPGERPLPGRVYLAPDALHLIVGQDGRLALADKEPQEALCPSIARLFRSVAEVLKEQAAGIILTGMGEDGARELKLMRNAGAVTIAQDKESSTVHGMPGAAIKLDAATYILSPSEIAATLAALAGAEPAKKTGGIQ